MGCAGGLLSAFLLPRSPLPVGPPGGPAGTAQASDLLAHSVLAPSPRPGSRTRPWHPSPSGSQLSTHPVAPRATRAWAAYLPAPPDGTDWARSGALAGQTVGRGHQVTRWSVSPWTAVSGAVTCLYRVTSQPASAVRAPRRRAQVPPDQASSAGTILPPRAHLTTSGETSGCDSWGTECCWPRVCSPSRESQDRRRGPEASCQDVSSAGAERPCSALPLVSPRCPTPHLTGPPPQRSGERRGLKSEGAEESPWRGAVGSRHALPLSKGQPRLQARSGTQVPLIDLSAGTRR